MANQFDPAFAAGRFQDAIGRIYFIERNPALPTVVQATCTGLAGVPIPVGALARAEDGNVYTCTEAGTIPQSGSIVLSFECSTPGPIACPAGTLDRIFQAIPGLGQHHQPHRRRARQRCREPRGFRDEAAGLGSSKLARFCPVGSRRGAERPGRARRVCDRKPVRRAGHCRRSDTRSELALCRGRGWRRARCRNRDLVEEGAGLQLQRQHHGHRAGSEVRACLRRSRTIRSRS